MHIPFDFWLFWVGYFIWFSATLFAVYCTQDESLPNHQHYAWIAASVVLNIAPFVAIGMS